MAFLGFSPWSNSYHTSDNGVGLITFAWQIVHFKKRTSWSYRRSRWGKKTLIDELDMVELPYLHCVVNETHTPPTRSAAPHTSHIRIPRGTILFAKKLNPKRFKGYRGGKMSWNSYHWLGEKGVPMWKLGNARTRTVNYR